MNRTISTILALAISCALVWAGNMRQAVHHYSVADGLPQNTVMAIMEDQDGFMWIGTWDGLCRFDGYTFKSYKPSFSSSQSASNRIDFLYEDSLGFIWARNYEGAFFRLNKHTDRILPTNLHDSRFGNRMPQKNLLAEQAGGLLWLAGDNQLLRLEQNDQLGTSDQVEQEAYTLPADANFLLADDYSNLWVGTNKGIACFHDELGTFTPGATDAENCFTVGTQAYSTLWFGTTSGVLWRYTQSAQRFEAVRLGHSPITGIAEVGKNQLLITTEGDGFILYNHFTSETHIYSASTSSAIISNSFIAPYVDSKGIVWLVNAQQGVWRFEPQERKLQLFHTAIDDRYRDQLVDNFFAFERPDGMVWLNPQGGGFCCYDAGTNQLLSPLGGCTNMVHSAFIDQRGSLWLGTYDLGLDRVDAFPERFNLMDLRNTPNSAGEARSFCQLRNGDLLVGTKDLRVTRYNNHVKIAEEYFPERVYTILENADGSVLYGTRGKGIILRNNSGENVFVHKEKDPSTLSCNDIYDLLYDADSTLYVATYGGGVNIYKNGQFLHANNGWKAYPKNFGEKVRCLERINDTTIWAACTSGLLRINTHTLETRMTPYFDIRTIVQTPDGHVWLGTFGGGLVEVLTPEADDVFSVKNARTYTSKTGLLSDIVLSIVPMPNGDLWFSFEEGLSSFNHEAGTFQHFNVLNYEKQACFSEAKALLLTNGELLFGFNRGLCAFSPFDLNQSVEFPRVQFTDFLLANKAVAIGEDGPLSDNICYATEINLDHNHTFTIVFAAIDYAHAEHILYAYRLDGLDKEWNFVEHNHSATYTNLAPGEYTFRVRCTNADGIWSSEEKTIRIIVHPPFWSTTWAWIIYILLFGGLVWFVYDYFHTGNQLRQEMAIEQKVTDIKLRFFTNISHELRTPLTLITGPVDNVLHNEDISPSVRTQLEIVSSNASRMLRLINHILDFRKIQNNKMRLRVQETSLNKLAESTYANFTKEAIDKHVSFVFEPAETDVMAWVDREKVDTIIYNLLSNAFKFTPSGKSIALRVKEKSNFAVIEVADTGIGMPKDQRAVIFERFASNRETNANANKQGTGIGLNLVKELVDLHHGYIEVQSEPGKGTTFTIMFRQGRAHFQQEADIVFDDHNSPVAADNVAEQEEENTTQQDPNLKTILVVDDNDDMRVFLHSILSQEYNVLSASDGEEAIKVGSTHSVDIVLTDLMMPNMDGLELTQRLKSAVTTSHIPVLLLTAKSAIESRLKALEYGADDYITKPFSPEYLLARIDNIVRQRERLQETFRRQLMVPREPIIEEKPKSPNDIFLEKLYQFMLHNLDNNALTVDDMVHEMALGRTVFFNKLKSLTGLSPVEYIRDVRIKRAAELLLDSTHNITEVAYMVGMNDSRYFAKCFKSVYGLTPTEYKKKNTPK